MGQSLESLDLMEVHLKKGFKILPEEVLDEYFKEFPPQIMDASHQEGAGVYFLKLGEHGRHDLGLTFQYGGLTWMNSDDGTVNIITAHTAAINSLASILNGWYREKSKTMSGNESAIIPKVFDHDGLIKAILNWISVNIKEEDLENAELPLVT